MRKFIPVFLLWLSPFLALLSIVSACSENEKYLAHGTTEEENAQNITDTIAYMKILSTWEQSEPVDSSKVVLGGDSSVSWYEVSFDSEGEQYFAFAPAEPGADSSSIYIYKKQNAVRLSLALGETKKTLTQILSRDSLYAVAMDRLDNSYAEGDESACREDAESFEEDCEKADGEFVDQLGLESCMELHLVCTRKFIAKVSAEEYLTNSAAELKKRGEEELGIDDSKDTTAKKMGLEGKLPWQYLNADIEYGEVVDERDGQVYKTVKMDSAVWMAENLNYADSSATPSLLGKNWCYGNEADSCTKYGRLYTWAAAIDSVAIANDPENPLTCGNGTVCKNLEKVQGICMDGWHLPSTKELHDVEDQASALLPKVEVVDEGEPDRVSNMLRSATAWPYGSDIFGFSLLPGGYYLFDSDEFKNAGEKAFFWSLDYAEEYAWMFIMYDDYTSWATGTHISVNEKYMYAISVRCVKD